MRVGHRKLIIAGLCVALAGAALAQQPMRVRGQIEKIDGNTLAVRARDGAELTIRLAENARITALVTASLADVRPNSYIGVTAQPQPDGTQKAIAIHIFPEAMRGTAEGQQPWDLRPGSTMTNAAVETTAAGVDGQVLTVKYRMGERTGEQKVIVPPQTPIVTYAPAEPGELRPGAQIITSAQRQPDGTLRSQSISVGRGLTPPM